jgi:phage terminase large subunit
MYERFLDVNQVLDRMKSLVPIDKNIVCDIAPQITKVFRNAGYRIIDAEKGKKVDAVKMLQSEIVIMDRKSKHLHSEQAAYTWKYDERTNRYLDELNDGNDHVLDAILYGYITKFANKGDAQVQKLKLYKPTLT